MKVSILYFRALSTCTVAFLAACGGSQLSIGAPGGLPQSRASRDLPLQGAPSSASLYGYKVLYRFTNAEFGNQPSAPLYNYKGTFYGTTVEGFGAVFSITKRGEVRLIHGFGGPPYDGGNPSSGLIEKNGTFYGETSWGGASCLGSYSSRCGTVFSVTPSGTEKVLHSFGSGSDGVGPNGGLVDVNGTLYGTTGSGGAYDVGTLFSVTTSGTEHNKSQNECDCSKRSVVKPRGRLRLRSCLNMHVMIDEYVEHLRRRYRHVFTAYEVVREQP
jgi:uncharacterized repeat protein (TIGR03803 family)